MSRTTPRFGLSFFGGTVEGNLAEDGQKYTGADRLTIDRVLAGLEANDGHVALVPTTPAAPHKPTLELGTDGQLSAGTRFYYRLAFVDASGLEGPAGVEESIATPPPIGAPDAPYITEADPEANPGVLPLGLYYYGLTALASPATGAEQSPLGPVSAATIGPDVNALMIITSTDPPPGTQLYAVWRMGPNEAGFTRIGTCLPGEVFTDNGSVPANPCACDPGVAPPMSARAVGRYSVTLTVNTDDEPFLTAAGRTVAKMRLYRSTQAGAYSGSSLVAEITASADEPLPTEFTDDGRATTTGAPSDVDRRLNLQPYVFDHRDELPDPLPFPAYYPLVVGEALYAKIGGGWVAVGGGGGGGSSIMTAPDGNRWRLSVGSDGTLSTTPTPEPGPPTAPQGA